MLKKIKKKINHCNLMIDEWAMGTTVALSIFTIMIGKEIKRKLKRSKREDKRK